MTRIKSQNQSTIEVAFVLTRLSTGGSVTLVRSRVAALQGHNIDVRVISLLPDAPQADSIDSFVEFLADARVPLYRINHSGRTAVFRTLSRLLKAFRGASVVHSVNSQDLYAPLAAALTRAVFVRDLVSTEPAQTLAARISSLAARRNVAISEAVKAASSCPRTLVVYPPVFDAGSRLVQQERSSEFAGHFVVLLVGRLERLKGLDRLPSIVEATRSLIPEVHFLVAGDGDFGHILQRELLAQGLGECVSLLGFRSDIRELHSSSDVYLSLSRAEGLVGYATLEAAMLGTPIVATDIPAVSEVLRDEREALLVDADDSVSAAQAIYKLSSDVHLAGLLVQSARERSERLLGPRSTGDELISLYRNVIPT